MLAKLQQSPTAEPAAEQIKVFLDLADKMHAGNAAQLRSAFAAVADRWENYARSRTNRTRALAYKSVFKLRYY